MSSQDIVGIVFHLLWSALFGTFVVIAAAEVARKTVKEELEKRGRAPIKLKAGAASGSMHVQYLDEARATATGLTLGRVIPKSDPEPEPVLLAALRAKKLKPDAQYTMRDIAPEHVGDFLDWIDGLKRALADAETEAAMERMQGGVQGEERAP